MLNKKRILILFIFFVISSQVTLFVNNKQKSSFRYFIWNIQEVTIGNLICISFISGFLINAIIDKSMFSYLEEPQIKSNNKNYQSEENEDEYEDEGNNKYKIEMPPQRDIRDTQPTVSVNYRVVKNNGNNIGNDEESYRNEQINDDWSNENSEW